MAVKLRKIDKTFVDVSLAFDPNPLTGDITLLLNERAINNSIKNLIMIIPSEVPFDRDIGSTIRDYLFENIDMATAGLISNEVKRAIRFSEPRVELLDAIVDPRPDENHFMVTVVYKIVGYEQTFTVSQILEPTR